MRSLILLAVTLASVCLLAQDSDPNSTPTKARPCVGEHPPQPCVVQPVPVSQPRRTIPTKGRKRKWKDVCLDFVVGVDGRTHDVHVTKSLGSGLDEKSVEAVTQWTFKPGTVDSKPVAVKLRGSVSFHLR